MEINKVKYKKPIKPQDFSKRPGKQRWYVRILVRLLTFILTFGKKITYKRINMDGLKKTPYLLLCNHIQFLDFPIAAKAMKFRPMNNVVAMDAFDAKGALMLRGGCIPKRKFLKEISTIRNMHYALTKLHSVAAMYPEARYTMWGTTADLPESLGKMIKMFKVPVATLMCNGSHLLNPRWGDQKARKEVPVVATLQPLLTAEQVETMTAQEINEVLRVAFVYDDYKYWQEKGFKITYKNRAAGLHSVLYKCPSCGKDYSITSAGAELKCTECGDTWELGEDGFLRARKGETRFNHVPDWAEWQRTEVRKELEAGTYKIEFDTDTLSMPNRKDVIALGTSHFRHDMNGFDVKGHYNGEEYHIVKHPLENYSVQTELNFPNKPKYTKRRHTIGLSVPDDSFYFFPRPDGMAIKIYLATEELYKMKKTADPTHTS